MIVRVVLCLLALPALAVAQPTPAVPCILCPRGDAVIAQFSLQPVRALGPQLAALELSEPLTEQQYAQIVELRTATPALLRIAALEEADLLALSASLCGASSGPCWEATARSLRCVADRCEVAFRKPDPEREDVREVSTRCRESKPDKPPTPFGVGLDWSTGWQRSAAPTDGRAWSFGIESRLRFTRRLGVVARVDRIAGRDEAIDEDGNGTDDSSTGSITRISALAGPSLVLDHVPFESTYRIARLDLLAGYVSTRSQPDESGPAVGFDLGYQLSVIRLGLRVVQGLGEARDATMVLAHYGYLVGAVPPLRWDRSTCSPVAIERKSRFAIGFDFPIGGYGISKELGYLPVGIGVEGIMRIYKRFDFVAHADMLIFPGDDRDRVIHQAVLGGFRFDHAKRRRDDTGFLTFLMAGYTHGATLTPTNVGSGPVLDAAFGWGGQGREGAANMRLHGRFGLGSDNREYRAVFLSFGLELRLDPNSWRDRG